MSSKPKLPLFLPLLALIAVILAGAVWYLGDPARRTPTTTVTVTEAVGPTNIGGPFTLTDQNGARRSDAEFRGKYMLIFFGYTFCPDVCPTTLSVMGAALDQLGKNADRIVPIFITVDPARDKPEVLKAYLSAFGPNFVGLTGSEEEIQAVAKSYRVYIQAHKEQGENYAVDHSGIVYLMDKKGGFLANYSLDTPPDRMAMDLQKKALN